jgi:hypothetical protein
MSEYSISNLLTQVQTVYTLNIVTFLQNKTLNYNNYLYFILFLVLRLITLFFTGYQLSIFNVSLMLFQSIYLLGACFIVYNLITNINKGPLAILLVAHLIVIYIMNLLFKTYDY